MGDQSKKVNERGGEFSILDRYDSGTTLHLKAVEAKDIGTDQCRLCALNNKMLCHLMSCTPQERKHKKLFNSKHVYFVLRDTPK